MTRFQEDIEGACLAMAAIGCALVAAAFVWGVGSLVSFAVLDEALSWRLFARIGALGLAGVVTAVVFVLLPVAVPRLLAEN